MEAFEPSLKPDGGRRAAARSRDRRHVARYPCLARIHAGDRVGVAVNISTDGLSFHTMDQFQPLEQVELCLAFEMTRAPLLEVVQTATVVWSRTEAEGCPWRVGVKFPH